MFDPLFFRVANTYRKLTTIRAEQWNGLVDFGKIIDFIAETNPAPDEYFKVHGVGGDNYWASIYDQLHFTWIKLERGDWVARGPDNEYYPIKNEVFTKTYELVD